MKRRSLDRSPPALLRPAIFVSLLLASGALGRTIDEDVPPAEAAEIRRVLTEWWESIDTLRFRCREGAAQPGEPFKIDGPGLLFEHAYGSGGRRSLRIREIGLGGVERYRVDRREDGRTAYQVLPFQDHPESIRKLILTNPSKGPEYEDGTMVPALWLIAPAGIPLSEHLRQGARLVRSTGNAGPPDTLLVFNSRGVTTTCLLDPAHDWLPREIRIRSKSDLHWKADQFAKRAGHWFPTAGTCSSPSKGGKTVASKFILADLEINTPIDPATFGPPTLPEGAVVEDATGKGVSRIHTLNPRLGLEARMRLLETHAASHPPVPKRNRTPTTPPPRAAIDPSDSVWPFVVGTGGIALLILALYLRSRGGTTRQS